MRRAILSDYERLKNYPDYFQNEDYSQVDKFIKNKFNKGITPIERTSKTNVDIFYKKYGYDLPKEIQYYINIFWHSYISGFNKEMQKYSDEAITLFQVLKYQNESDDEVIYHKCGLMYMADDFIECSGDIQKFIPIGWTGCSGGYVLYEVNTSKIYITDLDDNLIKTPIAGNLAELIGELELMI